MKLCMLNFIFIFDENLRVRVRWMFSDSTTSTFTLTNQPTNSSNNLTMASLIFTLAAVVHARERRQDAASFLPTASPTQETHHQFDPAATIKTSRIPISKLIQACGLPFLSLSLSHYRTSREQRQAMPRTERYHLCPHILMTLMQGLWALSLSSRRPPLLI